MSEPARAEPPKRTGDLVHVERIQGSGVLGETTAMIEGRAALVLAAILAGSLRDRLTLDRLLDRMELDLASRAAALRGWRVLEEAGESWRRQATQPISARGNAETGGSAPALASIPLASPFDSRQAGLVLGCSTRRVRQLAARGDLAGVRTAGGQWLFERQAVVDFRDRRQQGAA
jgi:excisionase family DNA binding protein